MHELSEHVNSARGAARPCWQTNVSFRRGRSRTFWGQISNDRLPTWFWTYGHAIAITESETGCLFATSKCNK